MNSMQVIQPVQSARITTQTSASISFGKVEVRAKLPKGDWLWPAIWMLPVDNAYGPWPLSGEIDVCPVSYIISQQILTYAYLARSWKAAATPLPTPPKAQTSSAPPLTGARFPLSQPEPSAGNPKNGPPTPTTSTPIRSSGTRSSCGSRSTRGCTRCCVSISIRMGKGKGSLRGVGSRRRHRMGAASLC